MSSSDDGELSEESGSGSPLGRVLCVCVARDEFAENHSVCSFVFCWFCCLDGFNGWYCDGDKLKVCGRKVWIGDNWRYLLSVRPQNLDGGCCGLMRVDDWDGITGDVVNVIIGPVTEHAVVFVIGSCIFEFAGVFG